MNLAKKTVLTNIAQNALNIDARNVEDALIELHKNDNDKFAMGDVKLSARDISDTNWIKCDGSPLTSMPESTVRKNLINGNSFSNQTISVSGYTISNSGENVYIDDNYMIVPAVQTSGGNISVVLLVYTRNNGLFTFSGAKVLWTHVQSGTQGNYGGIVKSIIKCGAYYYAIWKWWLYTDSAQTVNWYASYTTNPTSTWTNVEIVSKGTTQSANYLYLLSADTDNSSIKISICGNSTANGITIYTGTGTLSNLVETTQTTSTSINISDTVKSIPTGIAQGSMSAHGNVGGWNTVIYKDSFNGNWQILTRPASWARAFYNVFYIDSRWWGLYSSNETGLFVVIADSLAELSTGTLSNLTKIDISLSGYVSDTYVNSVALIGDGLSLYIRVLEDDIYKTYLCRVTSDGTLYNVVTNSSYGSGTFTNNQLATGFTMTNANSAFICSLLSLPNVNISGISAYMKVADN